VGHVSNYEVAASDSRSFIAFDVETFGINVLEQADSLKELFVAKAVLPA
jgi:hypothetical protein